MLKDRRFFLPGVLAALVLAVLVVSGAVSGVLFDRAAYGRFAERTGLAAAVGMEGEEVLANYEALIGYNSIFFSGPLELPSFAMSDSGRVHFEEVKAIFVAFQGALIVSAAGSAVLGAVLLRRRRFLFLRLGGIFALAIPAAVAAVMAAVGWERFFVLFHRLAFDNDFWVFDAASDPVIGILPDGYFLGCLVRIVAAVCVSAVLLIAMPTVFERFHVFRGSQRFVFPRKI